MKRQKPRTLKSFPIKKAIRDVELHVKELSLPWLDDMTRSDRDPFRVLVSCILSLRTQDRTTAAATRRLFNKISGPEDLLNLPENDIEKLIFPVGFYRTKARRLKEIVSLLMRNYHGNVPDDIGELLKLPGVGRKTANIVLTLGFKKDAIAVDTHVHRIFNRWGYVNTRKPEETEKALMQKLPRKYWRSINSLLVAFGQGICKPVSPLCSRCRLDQYCPKTGVSKHR